MSTIGLSSDREEQKTASERVETICGTVPPRALPHDRRDAVKLGVILDDDALARHIRQGFFD